MDSNIKLLDANKLVSELNARISHNPIDESTRIELEDLMNTLDKFDCTASVLQSYDTSELKEELKRRTEISKAQRLEKLKTEKRCRNCIHCKRCSSWGSWNSYECRARTWGKDNDRYYKVSQSKRACELFERKPSDD